MEEKKDDWNKHRNWWTRGTEPEEDGLDISVLLIE